MAEGKREKSYNNIDFPNENFKILAVAGRASDINSIDDFSKVFHEEIEIKLFYEGSPTLLIGNDNIIPSPGDVVVINPYEFHSTVDCGTNPGKYHLLIIGLDFFGSSSDGFLDLRRIFIGERTCIMSLIRSDKRIARIVNEIVTELYEKSDMYEYIVRGLVSELFALLLRNYRKDGAGAFPTDKHIRHYEIIYPAIRKIRKDYAMKISLEELSAMCNISKYHFCRIFKEVTSTSVVQYQNEYRLRVADVFLKKSNKSISEIATLCGFEDVCYFSRCYKKYYGVSPQKNRAILSK